MGEWRDKSIQPIEVGDLYILLLCYSFIACLNETMKHFNPSCFEHPEFNFL